jgi:hypothetical protein
VHVHVLEKRARLDELVLPTLTNAVDLGDEHRRVAGPNGTDFYETLTVAASEPGEAAFSPAYIDALDPLSGKPLRYSSDAVTVRVVAASPLDAVTRTSRSTLWTLAAIVAAAAVAVFLLAMLARLARRRPSAAAAPPHAVAAGPPAAEDPLRDAIALVRARGDDESMDMLRVVLFARAGLGTGATLGDALHELGDREPQLASTLEASERARFGPLADRPAATRELLGLLYDYASGEQSAT